MKEQYLTAINFYLQGMTKGQALRKAGFKFSARRPSDIFEKPEVKEELERRMKDMAERNSVTEDYIVNKLKIIAEANIGDLVEVIDGTPRLNFDLLTDEVRAAISDISVDEYKSGRGAGAIPVTKIKIKASDKLRALELLMRIGGFDKTKIEVSAEDGLIEKLQAARTRLNNTAE